MGKVAIITANCGGYDAVHPQMEQDIDVDWILCDDGEVSTPIPDVWLSGQHDRLLETVEGEDARLRAKEPKMEPWRITAGYDHYIWIDASMEVTSPAFAREAIACVPQNKYGGVAAWAHPRRDCVYDEAEASLGSESQGKYDAEALRAQMEEYRGFDYPEHAGLFACGTIVWEPRWWRAEKLGRKWHAECRKHTLQDQVSFPVVARRCHVEPGVFPFSQMTGRSPENRWLKIHPHLR